MLSSFLLVWKPVWSHSSIPALSLRVIMITIYKRRGVSPIQFRAKTNTASPGLDYPPNFFEAFLQNLGPPLQAIIVRVLSLLARLTANSALSGHTPPTLSPLFGPLFFGLGPATLAFHHAYIHYLRAVNAMEHLILAFIRWQDTPRVTTSSGAPMLFPSGSAAGLGVPTRLKEWIKGYPSMLPFLQQSKNVKPQARQGARTVRVMGVRRNVRMYSPDLVKSASSWAASKSALGGLASSKEWERIAPSTLKLPPRYSETYKKRMNMPQNFHPDTGSGMAVPPTVSTSPSTSSYTSTMSSGRNSSLLGGDQDPFGLGAREGEDRFRSLTDLKWGEFESMGFSALGDEKKLQFDLTESARTVRIGSFQKKSSSFIHSLYRNVLLNAKLYLGMISLHLDSPGQTDR